MATPIIMPKFGMAQEEGTILRWLKHEGDTVAKGDVLLEVQTDKVDMEVESPASGVLRDVRYSEDATVPVTTVIAVIAGLQEELRIRADAGSHQAVAQPTIVDIQPPVEPRVTPVAQRIATEQGVDLQGISGTGAAGRITKADVERLTSASSTLVRATPAARRLARESGVELDSVVGTGPSGRVQASDVASGVAQLTPQPPAAQPTGARPLKPDGVLTGKRRVIASRMTQSWQSTPHIFLTVAVDMTNAEHLRVDLAEEAALQGAKLSVTAVIAHALAKALARHPRMNALLRNQGDELVLQTEQDVNLGIAVALPEGLIVPVLKDAAKIGLAETARRIGVISAAARESRLTPDDVRGGTFTLSNLGMFAVDHFTAIINQPQVGILAVGRMQTRPEWDGAAFQPRQMLEITLSADHRAVDGATASAFLSELKRLLEDPRRLML
jgi:pyruvate dehydrogenase E2 component (dihydrolipoamide acetyltransferase)